MMDLVTIAIATLAGLILVKQIQPFWFRLFIPYLLLTLLVEASVAFNWGNVASYTNQYYNVFTSFEFCFYFYAFYRSFKKSSLQKAALLAIPIYLLIDFIVILFIQGFDRFHTISYRIATIAVIYFCYCYFKQLLEVDTQVNILRAPMFWVSCALMFFYAGFFVYFTAYDYVAFTKSKLNLQVWQTLSRGLNVLLYSLFLIAFICNLKRPVLLK